MKPTNQCPTSLAWQKIRNTVALLVVVLVFTGCFRHYFKTNTQTTADPTILDSFQKSKKYFIVHFSDGNIFGLDNVSITNDKIEGNLVILPDEHNKYLHPGADSTYPVKKKHKSTVLMEVHLYITNSLSDTSRLSVPLISVNRLDVYTNNAKRTRANHIFSVVGIVAGAVFITFVILISQVGYYY